MVFAVKIRVGLPAKTLLISLAVGIGLLFFVPNSAQAQGLFIRGDVNCDGVVDSADVFFLDSLMNHGGSLPPCLAAADVNDDGLILSVADLTFLLRALDLGLALPPPFPNCGTDPTFDGFACDTSCCIPTSCTAKPGDVNANGTLSLSDIIVLVNHVFKGGTAPEPACRGDANADTMLNLNDIIYLMNFVFRNGPYPIPSDFCCL